MVLAFLITSIAKRDPVGRKPKRKIFAMEGLLVVDKELKKDGGSSSIFNIVSELTTYHTFTVAPWASAADIEAHYSRLNKLKADLIFELVGVSLPPSPEYTNTMAGSGYAQRIRRSRTTPSGSHLTYEE
jgi:hypothetical protein